MQTLISKIKGFINPVSPATILKSTTTTPNPATVSVIIKPAASPQPQKDTVRKVKLIMVTENNNNKFYEMTDNNDGTFKVLYGRVGSRQTEVTYPISEWNSKYNEKIRKGYIDNTHLFAVSTPESDTSSIQDKSVKSLIDSFMKYARNSIFNNYIVSATEVTQKQVDEAQNLVNSLIKMIDKGMDIGSFNQQLLDLFKVIPRKMSNVKEHLLSVSPTNIDEINAIKAQIVEEQATLDVMRSQVEINEKQAESTKDKEIDLLQLLGLQIETVEDPKIKKLIKLMMGKHGDKFVEAYQVTNNRTQKGFDNWISKAKNPKTQLLWHGSRNENWLSILRTGLVLRPVNAIITGKMFGYGVYFANEFSKSLNYSSLCGSVWTNGNSNEAYLAIFEVHTGSQLEISQHEAWHTQLTEDKLKGINKNYDSVFAKRGVSLLNNEFIVYNEAQCTIKYIVKIK